MAICFPESPLIRASSFSEKLHTAKEGASEREREDNEGLDRKEVELRSTLGCSYFFTAQIRRGIPQNARHSMFGVM